jgi:hypothetical protein
MQQRNPTKQEKDVGVTVIKAGVNTLQRTLQWSVESRAPWVKSVEHQRRLQ